MKVFWVLWIRGLQETAKKTHNNMCAYYLYVCKQHTWLFAVLSPARRLDWGSRFLPDCCSVHSSLPLVWTSPYSSSACGSWLYLSKQEREQERESKREPVRNVEARVFCSLILNVTSNHFWDIHE